MQKGVEFDTFESGVVQHLPSTEKLKGITITHPITDMIFTFLTLYHIGKTNIIAIFL